MYRTSECIRTTSRKARDIPIGCLGMKPKISLSIPFAGMLEWSSNSHKPTTGCRPFLAALNILLCLFSVYIVPLLHQTDDFPGLLE